MKSKFASIIISIITILMVGIWVAIGFILYKDLSGSGIQSEVQNFVSNIEVIGASTSENLTTPQIVETSVSSTEHQAENTGYEETQIDKYLYNQLDDYSRIIYKAMEYNKDNMKSGDYEINLGTKFSQLLSRTNGEELLGEYYQSAIEAYAYDNPDVFYIDFSKLYLNIETKTKQNSTTYKVYINAGQGGNYLTSTFASKEEVDLALKKVEKIKSYFVRNKKESPYENVKMIHDYIVESTEYDQTLSKSDIYNMYGALVNKECVCEGYAKAFKYLVDGVDVPCTIVIGQATNSDGVTENHAWNYVQLNKTWYAIDTTWDDPIIVGYKLRNNSVKYQYFLKGSDEFNKTHTAIGKFTEKGKTFYFPTLSQNNYLK